MQRDVGMTMPKTEEKLGVAMTVCRQDVLYKEYTSYLIPTSSSLEWLITRVFGSVRALWACRRHPYIESGDYI